MPAPRILVLRAPGTNCDLETAAAFEAAGGVPERVHVNRLSENPALGDRYQILCLPGGFSYGDDIAAGRILAVRLKQHLGDLVNDFVNGDDRLVLGICNGMQVLMRLGVLAGQGDMAGQGDTAGDGDTAGQVDTALQGESKPAATLTWNNHGRFEDRWVHLKTDPRSPCVFTRGAEHLFLPIAHAEGKFVAADTPTLRSLDQAGRLALRYVDGPEGTLGTDTLPFPANPNGADANVAGVCDTSGRVFGLMPHPERHIDPTHHPFWTRRDQQPESGDGLVIFRNAIEYFV